jgi:phage tail sheath protein FI
MPNETVILMVGGDRDHPVLPMNQDDDLNEMLAALHTHGLTLAELVSGSYEEEAEAEAQDEAFSHESATRG